MYLASPLVVAASAIAGRIVGPAEIQAMRPGWSARAACVAAIALATVACDEVHALFGGGWKATGTNGERSELHFGLNPFDLRKDDPEHVRIERHETRTVAKPDGTKEEETRDRKVQVVAARCIPASLCDAQPFLSDSREVVVTPRMIGGGRLEVTVALDGDESLRDQVAIRVGM